MPSSCSMPAAHACRRPAASHALTDGARGSLHRTHGSDADRRVQPPAARPVMLVAMAGLGLGQTFHPTNRSYRPG